MNRFKAQHFNIIVASECLYSSVYASGFLKVIFLPSKFHSLYGILYKTLLEIADANTEVFISYEPRIDREHQFFEMVQESFDILEVRRRHKPPRPGRCAPLTPRPSAWKPR